MIELDPNGDVILVLDDSKLKVSSKSLARASPVLEALFRPGFREGNSLQAKGTEPVSIELPDDDSHAMFAICSIIHRKFKEVEVSSAIQLEEIAMVADKYDCLEAISWWGAQCVSILLRKGQVEFSDGRLLFPAVFFNDYIGFREVTRAMAFKRNGLREIFMGRKLFPDIPEDVLALLPENIITKIWRFEWYAKKELMTSLETILWPALAKALGVGRNSFRECDCPDVSALIKELRESGLYPTAHVYDTFSVEEIIKRLRKGYDRYSNMPESKCYFSNLIFTKVHDVLEWEKSNRTGLCLDCVKSWTPERKAQESRCRFGHLYRRSLWTDDP